VRKAATMQVLAALAMLGAGLWMAGCKSAPELTQAQAMSMIQAKYDQSPGITFNISVGDRGMQQGVAAKYWVGTKRYPNGYWGDFTLTPDGKKVVKLLAGGDNIQWRPDGPSDPRYAIVVVPLVTSHLKDEPLEGAEPRRCGDRGGHENNDLHGGCGPNGNARCAAKYRAQSWQRAEQAARGDLCAEQRSLDAAIDRIRSL
jgi:hypothetical protein